MWIISRGTISGDKTVGFICSGLNIRADRHLYGRIGLFKYDKQTTREKLFHSYCRKIQESIEGINSTFLSRSVEGQSRTQLCDWPLTLILHSHKTNPIIPWWPCTLITFLVLVPILFPPRTLPNWWFTERWGIFCPRSKMTNISSIAGTWSASSDN